MEQYNAQQLQLVEVVDQLMNVAVQHEKHRFHYCGVTVSPSEVRALRIIGENPELNVTEVARRLNISKSAVCKMTKKLQQKGLVQRLKAKDNRRDVVMSLSPQGSAVFDSIMEYYLEIRRELVRRLHPETPQHRMAVIDFLTTLKDVLAAVSETSD